MKKLISVGMGSCGIACGAKSVYAKFSELVSAANNNEIVLRHVACIGMCHREVLVEVGDEGGKTMYAEVTPETATKIWEQHILGNEKIPELTVSLLGQENDYFFGKQKRIVLRNCGNFNPESLKEAEEAGVYVALKKTLGKMKPEEVIETVLSSGLRGRGGAGFPTGLKWRFANQAKGEQKYMVCNADEGDPGAFMDRSVLEGDPHSVIEGMTIGAYAIGASKGYVYVRAEYPLAIVNLNLAIKEAMAKGYLGDNIFGTDFSFHLKVKEGAGAFVCGEETALLASIEGKRGMPRLRPPFPAQSGLWGKPTNINNVETLASIPWIINNGAEAYSNIGTEKSKGTKVFALAGKIKNGGLVEVPMGMSLREVVEDIGGGVPDGKVKAIQLGGPSGGCIPEDLLDTKVDYDEINATGAIMGSGGMVVMDKTTCMVDIARFFLDFTQKESCGKCTFCRIGTKRMLDILTRITEGEGKLEDIDTLEELAKTIKRASLCGLGQTAPNPVLTTLKYFRHEYEAHIKDKKCPAGRCAKLLTYDVVTDKCIGCTACARACPVGAISGDKKQPHVIDQEKCIKCGMCVSSCNFNAISVD